MDITNNDDCDLINTYSLFSPSSTSSPPSTPETHLYDELKSRYKVAITRLHELTREANSLQEENEWLRLANEDLIRRMNRLLPSSEEPLASGNGPNVVGLANANANANANSSESSIIVGSNSPTSVINDQYDERFMLPKSISVRSPGYFKLKSTSSPSSTTPSSTITTPIATSNDHLRLSQDVNGTRLRFQRNVEKAIEMDVYNQGMYKTELCNKWQETNTCPYGEHCRFAHGMSELRPVIRHPRYKSQVCRMVLAGGTCPYGHRCHFRHSMS